MDDASRARGCWSTNEAMSSVQYCSIQFRDGGYFQHRPALIQVLIRPVAPQPDTALATVIVIGTNVTKVGAAGFADYKLKRKRYINPQKC